MSVKFYNRIVKTFSGVVKTLFGMEIIGEENLPKEDGTPLLVCCNHLSATDVLFLGAYMKRHLRFVSKEEALHIPIFGWIAKNMDAIPIKRGQGDVGAIKAVIKVLESGGTVCIYPQGHRYPGVKPSEKSELKSGAGMMCWRSKCNVLPTAIIGKGWRIKPFRKNRIVIGKVIPFEELNITAGNPEEYKRVTSKIFSHITELCDKYELK